jgi:peptide deformylase
MSTLKILTYPEKFLLQPTRPLENIDGDVQQMIDAMAETMYQAPGIGLASIQVG